MNYKENKKQNEVMIPGVKEDRPCGRGFRDRKYKGWLFKQPHLVLVFQYAYEIKEIEEEES